MKSLLIRGITSRGIEIYSNYEYVSGEPDSIGSLQDEEQF